VTREQRWYAGEPERHEAETGAYAIARTPVTNDRYAAFVAATGHRAPDVDRDTWESYGLIHAYAATRRFAWVDGRRWTDGRRTAAATIRSCWSPMATRSPTPSGCRTRPASPGVCPPSRSGRRRCAARTAGAERFIVKGGSWDDSGCGVCRPAARHARPADLRHILIGFRVVREPDAAGPAPDRTP